MRGRHCGGYHHGADAREVGDIVPLRDHRPESTKVRRPRRIHIAATHGNPTATGDECQCTHPGTADSHEVHTAFIRGVEQCHVLLG
jgi:hypothetical protein